MHQWALCELKILFSSCSSWTPQVRIGSENVWMWLWINQKLSVQEMLKLNIWFTSTFTVDQKFLSIVVLFQNFRPLAAYEPYICNTIRECLQLYSLQHWLRLDPDYANHWFCVSRVGEARLQTGAKDGLAIRRNCSSASHMAQHASASMIRHQWFWLGMTSQTSVPTW